MLGGAGEVPADDAELSGSGEAAQTGGYLLPQLGQAGVAQSHQHQPTIGDLTGKVGELGAYRIAETGDERDATPALGVVRALDVLHRGSRDN